MEYDLFVSRLNRLLTKHFNTKVYVYGEDLQGKVNKLRDDIIISLDGMNLILDKLDVHYAEQLNGVFIKFTIPKQVVCKDVDMCTSIILDRAKLPGLENFELSLSVHIADNIVKTEYWLSSHTITGYSNIPFSSMVSLTVRPKMTIRTFPYVIKHKIRYYIDVLFGKIKK